MMSNKGWSDKLQPKAEVGRGGGMGRGYLEITECQVDTKFLSREGLLMGIELCSHTH